MNELMSIKLMKTSSPYVTAHFYGVSAKKKKKNAANTLPLKSVSTGGGDVGAIMDL